MKQSVLEYKKLLEQKGLLVEFAEPEGKEEEDRPVTLVTYFSGGADQGTLFLCKGAAFKEAYLKDAVNRGAVAYVSEKEYEAGKEIPALIVNDARKAQFVLGEAFYDYPAKSLHVTALTGTKGKTTTAYYLQSMLDACLKKQGGNGCALLSSIEYYDGKTREASTLTTPESLELCRHMRNAVDAGLSHMVMEVSSQALKYERVGNTHFDTAIFLNISKDHISPTEHKDFDDYFQSKLKIFDRCTCACVNLDSDHIGEILKAAAKCERVVTFGSKENAVIRVSDIKPGRGKFYFHVAGPDFSEDFTLPVHGAFNVENAVAAIAAAWSMGIPVSLIKESLLGVTVPGRMETYESSAGEVTAIVDFAHNGLSFEKMFDTVALEYPGSRVSVVFGTPGGKAFNRRKDMGEISGKRADRIFLVPDDPGNEDPQAICEEIGGYIAKEGASFQIRMDRGAAIREAILGAVPGEVVLILGKGADVTMHVGNRNVPYRSDAVYAKEALAEYGNAFAEAATARETEE